MQARRRLRIANKRKTRLTFFEDGATRRKGDDELTSETTQKADGENRTRLALDYCSHKKAIEIMGYARKLGFSIPDQIAVVGVDADPIVCGFSHPSLTSIEPDFERMGYAAAAALDAMMSGRKLNSVNRISCPPKGVVERASTYFLPPGKSLVDQAKTIVAQDATRGLSVKALSARLKVSPQLLALRFRQFGGTTPQNLILQTRLEQAKKLMRNPKIKLDAIAKQCGFSSKNRLFHVFKERFGITIGDFRAQE